MNSIDLFLEKDEQKDLLRLLTAGSVDDGKSTLIGRLLFDSKRLYEDQLQALKNESRKGSSTPDNIDYALLCDGLKAEREQGITIDRCGIPILCHLASQVYHCRHPWA